MLVGGDLREAEDPPIVMTRLEVKAMLRRKKEKAFTSSICLDLKPPYVAEVAAKPYPVVCNLTIPEV